MFKNFLLLTLKSIRYRPLRSWLTILGIVIGIMLVVVIFALGDGIQNVVARLLQQFGSDMVIIFPGKETNPFLGLASGQKFKEEDLVNLKMIPGVRLVVPMSIAVLNVEFNGEKKSVMFHSQPWREYKIVAEESQSLKFIEGKWPESEDSREVILGYRAAFKLFKTPPGVGDDLIIKGRRFKVAGIFSEVGLQEEDNQIWMSHKDFQALTSQRGTASAAALKLEKGANIDLVAKQIKFQLEKQEVVRDFSVLTPEKANQIIGNILSVIELVLVVIALVSLVVGAVGVMNTMYTSVLERTKQIGIMKAIGASSESILSLFLIESGMIGLVGGILGIILGITFAYLIGLAAANFGVRGLFSFASLDFFGFFVILVITFITGIISGILPARQASRMEPAEALRYE
ncbi:ABC transporter permease [Patescibacteria group bacterium]|nr:ABC transporter permease [Patescibacteria group bacterium]MBU4480874.1 ABC transporter permease [Patescibacteria group bacterium]